jgi:hypothetical protein
MARAKGGMTGADLKPSNRGKRGGLTDSKHFDKIPLDTDHTEATAEQFVNSSRTKSERPKQSTEYTRQGSKLGSDEHLAVFEQSKALANTYGVEISDIKAHMSASNDDVDSALGEGISAKVANERKLKIARQNNLIEVRLERIKQKRKLASLHKEEVSLVGDMVDVATTGVQVASKMVNHQIAVTDFKTTQSRLVEHEELLTQQQIRTQGTRSLTAGIAYEWELKAEKQDRANERVEIEIESADKRIEQARLEIEAFLLSD